MLDKLSKSPTYLKTMTAIGIVGLIVTLIEEKSSESKGDTRAVDEARKLREFITKATARSLIKLLWNNNNL